MTSRIEELYIRTRNHPISRHLIPLESTFSYPVPSLRDNHAYLRFMVYQRGRAPKNQPRPVYRPYIHLSIEYPSGRVVEYADLRFTEGAPESPTAELVGQGPSRAAASLDFSEVIALRADLYTAIESVIPLIGHVELAPAEAACVVAVRDLYAALIEPCLVPFYESLAPFFFEWMHAVTA